MHTQSVDSQASRARVTRLLASSSPALTARSTHRNIAIRALGCALLLLLASCAAVPRKSVVDSIDPAVKPSVRLDALLGTNDKNARNRWIEFNLIRIDESYYAYEKRLQALRTQWSVGTATSALLFNVASNLTGSAGVKANYVAANSLATGAGQIVSREAFLEQTVNSLVAAMQGRRAETRKRVRIGMTRPPEEYGVSDAYHDLLEYDNAGTLTQGMSFLVEATKKASAEEIAKANSEISRAVIYTDAERQLSFCVSESLDARPIDKTALGNVLKTVDVKFAADADEDAMVDALSDARENAPAVFERKVAEAMEANKLMKPCRRYQ